MKSRRTLLEEHAGMRAAMGAALEREAAALSEAGRERYARKVAERRAAEAEAAARRTHERNVILCELLEQARNANGDYELDRMEARLHRALRACTRYRTENTEQRTVVEHLTSQLMHSMGYTDAELRLLGIEPGSSWPGRAAA